MMLIVKPFNAFEHDQYHTKDDQHKKKEVKKFARRSVRLINHFMKFPFPSGLFFWFYQLEEVRGTVFNLLFFLR